MSVVTSSNLGEVISHLRTKQEFSVDTETTGLRPFHGDKPFSIVIGTDEREYYIPVDASLDGLEFLGRSELLELWEAVQNARLLFLANAKFDMHHLQTLSLDLPRSANIHDVSVVGRLLHNQLPSYSLDAMGQHFLRQRKDDKVKAYIGEHGLWEWVDVPDKSVRDKRMFFYKVPHDILVPYALQDARLTFDIGREQIRRIHKWDDSLPDGKPKLWPLYQREMELTRVCYEMEQNGVRIDRSLTERLLAISKQKFSEASNEFAVQTGREYVASAKCIISALQARGVDTSGLPKTDKGNVQFDADALKRICDPVAKLVLECKEAKSDINFYASFLWHADTSDVLHTDYRQGGTVTGRFSSSNPNTQNLSRPEEGDIDEASPRFCLVPESEDFCFLMMDYKQQEYRLMLEYALQMDLIEAVRSGLDVHQATAELSGLNRTQSKTLNFALLYGAGSERIANMLGLSLQEASDLIQTYFSKLPKVKELIEKVRFKAKHMGYILTWSGRILLYPLRSQAYASPNHLIQGGCADITREAMVQCHRFLAGKKSYLTLSIHDELVFNLYRSELHIVDELKSLMEKAYPHHHLPMEVDVSYSWKSLGEKIKGYPQA